MAAAAPAAEALIQEANAAEDLANASKDIDQVLDEHDFHGVSSYNSNEDETHTVENDMILPTLGEMPEAVPPVPHDEEDLNRAFDEFEQKLSGGEGSIAADEAPEAEPEPVTAAEPMAEPEAAFRAEILSM